MKACTRSIAIVNITLFVLFWWMFWMGNSYLPGKLDADMTSDVMLQKYELVCARLTASMTGMCFLAIVLINVVLIYTYFVLKKNVSPAAGGETPPEGGPAGAPSETKSNA